MHKSKTPSPTQPAWLAPFADPAKLFEHIESESVGTDDQDPYRIKVAHLMAEGLAEIEDPDIKQDIRAIRQLFNGDALEGLARKTGFVLGFEYCRDLMLSGAAKGGGR